MLRSMLAVLIGYVAIALLVSALFASLLWLLGPERVFVPGVLETRPWWNFATVGLGLGAAMVGGAVAFLIGRAGARPVAILAFAILVLGVVELVNNSSKLPPDQLPANTSVAEAITTVKRPTWYLAALPVTGAVGVIAGGGLAMRMTRRREPASEDPSPASARP